MTQVDLKRAPSLLVQYRSVETEPVLDGRSGKYGHITVAELLSPGWLTQDKFGGRLEVGEILLVAGSDGDVQARVTGLDRDRCFILRPFLAAPVAERPSPDHEPAEMPASRGRKPAA